MPNVVVPSSPFKRFAEHLLRSALVTVFIVFGLQKFSPIEARGIAPLVSNSPLTSWLNVLGVEGASMVVGASELTFGALLAVGFWRAGSKFALAGAAGSCLTFLTTLSFLLTTPGVFAPDAAPVMSADGLFLLKDIVLLATSVLMLSISLAQRGADSRRAAPAWVYGPRPAAEPVDD
ncbi:DUF417 family protein [Glacieibacterium megasporae]|uniref:DUF417 family protein n=1 Tax=Glacieibacterium megasporae TaxID=2835787 RepID=UPI001C1E4BD6|nr:DUF417 family protein [Polymorphobacter megasporae]UAJ11022.1 DUF417 family protein [Polymorphobacter megasporae]